VYLILDISCLHLLVISAATLGRIGKVIAAQAARSSYIKYHNFVDLLSMLGLKNKDSIDLDSLFIQSSETMANHCYCKQGTTYPMPPEDQGETLC